MLSFTTGHVRDYRKDPYAHRKFPRNPALLVCAGGLAKIYPFSELQKVSPSVVDRLGEHKVAVRFDSGSQTAKAKCEQSACAAYFVSYLDDLKAFFPEAKIFAGPR